MSFPRLRWLLLGLLVVTLLIPLVRVIAQENSVTYYTQEELPVRLSWWIPEIDLTIMIPDNLMDVARAVLTLTVTDSDQRGEAIFEIEDEEYRVHPTGTDDIEIPVDDLSNIVEIHFSLENRFRGGIEITELNLTLTFTQVTNPPPIADPGGTYYGTEGSEVQFDGSASYDPDGTIQAYFWTFGDNTSSTESTPLHSYLNDGEYLVSLTVTDDGGASTTETTQAIIDDADPVAFFSAELVATTPTLIYRFTDASISHDGIVNWDWAFGDGAWSKDQKPLHAYSVPGNYTVTLTVSEADGDQATLTLLTVISEDPYSSPILELEPNTQIGISGDSLTYLIKVTNQVPLQYETATFLLIAQVPNDWNGSFSVTSLTIAPGETRNSLFILTSPLTTVSGEYKFTIRATAVENPNRTNTVSGSYTVVSPPQVTVTALVEEQSVINFTVICISPSDDILQEIRLYINDQLKKTWTQAGTYTYGWIPSKPEPTTYYVTVITSSGSIVSDPQSGVYSLAQPSIPWNLFMYGILIAVTLFLVIYYGMRH
jgi:PKD repeat protein